MAKTNSQIIADDHDIWSHVLALYGGKPCWRSLIHSHLPQSMREDPRLLAPLLRKSLTCPSSFGDALYVASLFPELTPEVVMALRRPEMCALVSADSITSCLACLFGVTFHPKAFLAKSPLEQTRIRARVRSEFARRFDSDFDAVVASARLSFDSSSVQNDGGESQPLRKAF